MKANNTLKIITFLLIYLIVPLPAVFGLLHHGFFDPHDMHHLADIYEMYRAILSGQIPPRLGPDFSFGYMYPLFNYYYLLPFYIGALFYFLFGSLSISFKFVLIFSIYLAYLGMYKFLRLHFGKLASIAGAALFVYTPYRAVQIYVRGSLGEALALSLLPWILFLVSKYIRTLNNKYIAATSFVYFLLVITHNYFFALSFPIIFFYALYLLKHLEKPLAHLFAIIASILLGISASSYWTIPALIEKNLVRGDTPFLLADHFPFLKQLLIPSWGYGASVWGPSDELSFQIGAINLLAIFGLCVILAFYLKKRSLRKVDTLLCGFILFGFFICFVFMNIRTLFIWKLIPFHDLIQFPWRLLNFTTFFSSMAIAVIVNYLKSSKQRFVFGLSLLGMLVVSIFYFKPQTYFYKNDNDYLNLFFKTPGYSEDYLLLPVWVKARPSVIPSTYFESEKATIIDQGSIGSVEKWAKIESIGAAEIVANVYFFPGWKVLSNGKPVVTYKVGDFGKIGFQVPPGISHVVLKWEETTLRKFADFVSLISIIVIIIIYVKKTSQRYV